LFEFVRELFGNWVIADFGEKLDVQVLILTKNAGIREQCHGGGSIGRIPTSFLVVTSRANFTLPR
jgi:hypothetical protein